MVGRFKYPKGTKERLGARRASIMAWCLLFCRSQRCKRDANPIYRDRLYILGHLSIHATVNNNAVAAFMITGVYTGLFPSPVI